MSLAHSPLTDKDDAPTRETRQSLRTRQASITPQKRTISSTERMVAVESDHRDFPISYLENTSEPASTRPKRFHSVMAPNTCSSSNAKTRTLSANLNTLSSPTVVASSDGTIYASSSSSEGSDLLVNLRTDEIDQELNLNVKPPVLPKKAFENQGQWQIKPRDMNGAPHSSVYVRALEQAANRLVAKAKELVIIHDGDDVACQKPLLEAQEWCIDTIDMIAGEINSKKYKSKWNARKHEWDKRSDYKLRSDERND